MSTTGTGRGLAGTLRPARPEALRTHYLLDPAAAGVSALLRGNPTPAPVVQLNLASAVVLQPDGALPLGRQRVDLAIGHARFHGLGAHVEALDEPATMYASLRFLDMQPEQARQILRMLHDLLHRGIAQLPRTSIRSAEVMTAPEDLRRACASLFQHGSPLIVRSRTGAQWHGHAVGVDDGPLPLVLRHPGPRIEPPVALDVLGYNTVFRMRVERADERPDGTLQVAMPSAIERFGHRMRRRALPPQGLCVRFQHPLWPGEELVRPLRDIGTRGIGVQTDPDKDLLFVGLRLPRVEIVLHGKVIVQGAGLVCHVSWPPPSVARGLVWPAFAGLALAMPDEASDRRWLATVHNQLHPTARCGAYWRDFSWHVYERSGYFELSGKRPAEFASKRPDFATSSQRLDEAPWMGVQAVWPSPRGIEATFTFVKIYKRTWFGFQLAKWPGGKDVAAPSQQVLLDLYLRVFEHMQHDTQMRWVAGYLEANVKWNQVAQFAWARSKARPGGTVLRDFRLLEAETARFVKRNPRPAGAHPTVEVQAASPNQQEALAQHIASIRGDSWRDVLDLAPGRFALDDVEKLWRVAGLHRQRRVLVVCRERVVMAAAIVECGQDGVSLFSLLDGVRLFAMTTAGEEAFPALLHAAASWYAELQKPRFCVFFDELDDSEGLARYLGLGLRDLGPGKLWAVHRDELPDFLEHVHGLLAPKRSATHGSQGGANRA